MRATTKELVNIPAQIQRVFPRERMEGMRLAADYFFDVEQMVLRLTKDVWSERLADETVRWPATWWDAFKVRWFPRWYLNRWPAKWKWADFTVYRGYPDLVMPEQRSVHYIVRRYDAPL